jgi:hypothetical protein
MYTYKDEDSRQQVCCTEARTSSEYGLTTATKPIDHHYTTTTTTMVVVSPVARYIGVRWDTILKRGSVFVCMCVYKYGEGVSHKTEQHNHTACPAYYLHTHTLTNTPIYTVRTQTHTHIPR